MKNKLIIIILALIIILPIVASAYTLLQKLPESGDPVGKTTVTGLSDYLTWLYRFALGAAIFLAVLKIVIGGVLIIVGGASENAQGKGRDMIEMALWGLLLALCAWLLLNAINPDFVKGKFDLEPVTIERRAVSAPSTGGCSNCVNLSSLGSAVKFQVKSTACSGGFYNCYLSGTAVQNLNKLVTEAESLGLPASSWRMTEGYPPTVNHLDACHYNATCADIALMPGTATKEKVNKFIKAAQAAGFKVTNEYSGYGGNTFTTTTSDCLHVEI